MTLTYGKVEEPWWDDKTVAIVASGPSLRGFDYTQLEARAHVLAVKSAIFDIPWADAGTGIDAPRYIEWTDRLAKTQMPIYWAASGVHELAPLPHVTFLHRLESDGMTTDLGSLTGGGTSGYAAINLAAHKRAKRIALFGFDYGGAIGNWHASEEYYQRPRNQSMLKWKQWAARFEQLVAPLAALGIEVVNACPSSGITAFPKIEIDVAVDWL